MQRLAPQISALREKYKDDKQRQQQEIMKFYQEHKINPLASCLPLVLQIPVFISLFYMLRTDLKLDICGRQLREYYGKALEKGTLAHNSEIPQKAFTNAKGAHFKGLSDITCSQVPGAQHSAKFLFLPDITDKATGVALIVLIVLYVGSQIASTLVATATADPTQRRLMLLLPIVFVVILYRYPAGLLVYWITSNLWTIGQQYLIKKRMPPPPKPEPVKATGNGKPARSLKPALAGGGVAGPEPNGRSGGPPPRPPRKKKKRSGRRR
jgi:YidC/Oxa1 family membrane protein insertase